MKWKRKRSEERANQGKRLKTEMVGHWDRVDGWMVGWMGGLMAGWMGGWMDGWMDGWVAQMVAKGWQHFSLKTALILNYQVDSPASWTKQTADAELRKTEALCNGNETSIKVAHRATERESFEGEMWQAAKLFASRQPVSQFASLPTLRPLVLRCNEALGSEHLFGCHRA